jgi:hypothetical protein
VIAEGEAEKVFLDETEAKWFGSVYINKKWWTFPIYPPMWDSIEYAKRINNLLSSPPKKRQQVQNNHAPQS